MKNLFFWLRKKVGLYSLQNLIEAYQLGKQEGARWQSQALGGFFDRQMERLLGRDKNVN